MDLQSKLKAAESKIGSLQRELELAQQEKEMELTSLRKQHDAALAAAGVRPTATLWLLPGPPFSPACLPASLPFCLLSFPALVLQLRSVGPHPYCRRTTVGS